MSSKSSETACSVRSVTSREVLGDRCKMPTFFLIEVSKGVLLHLVEHVRESRFKRQSLLDFFTTDIGILAVFKKARTLMFAEKLDDSCRICRVVGRPTFQGLKS